MTAKHSVKKSLVLTVVALFAFMVLYLGTFLWHRCHYIEFSLAPHGHPQRRLVFFSRDPLGQQLLRGLYWPLIKLCPGQCYYPNGSETEIFWQPDPCLEDR